MSSHRSRGDSGSGNLTRNHQEESPTTRCAAGDVCKLRKPLRTTSLAVTAQNDNQTVQHSRWRSERDAGCAGAIPFADHPLCHQLMRHASSEPWSVAHGTALRNRSEYPPVTAASKTAPVQDGSPSLMSTDPRHQLRCRVHLDADQFLNRNADPISPVYWNRQSSYWSREGPRSVHASSISILFDCLSLGPRSVGQRVTRSRISSVRLVISRSPLV